MERKAVNYVALDLPRPISTNALWRPRPGGMCKTTAYKNWLTEAGLVLNTQRCGRVEGPYCLTIRVTKLWKGDLDNAAKATSDLLQAHNIIDNDRLAQRVIIERSDVSGVSVLVCSTSGGDDA
jgi:Holliday junction resolvase RusA-like endonuclease